MVLKSVIFLTILSFSGTPSLYDLNKKKVDKVLSESFEGDIFDMSIIKVDNLASTEAYAIKANGSELIGYTIINVAPSKVDTFTYMTVFDPQGYIRLVFILMYRENYGGEIASKRFLRQYEGKKAGENMEYSKDIDGISGATLSVRSLNNALQNDSKKMSLYLNNTE